jgi:uncharacterized membrane protein YoaK (UPF0700 family)
MQHDVRLAIMLCFSAGFINAAGFLAFQVLTTNVTGHAALLAVHAARCEVQAATVAAIWLLLFLSGAFLTGVIVRMAMRSLVSAYTLPLLVIIAIMVTVAVGGTAISTWPHARAYLTGGLLLAMGMQNALVTMVSGAMVRTTHLTGMFTDLGIDLSAIATGNAATEIYKRVVLRLTIIGFFLLGGIAGGFMQLHWHFTAFYVPVLVMLTALFYDRFRVTIKRLLRKAGVV